MTTLLTYFKALLKNSILDVDENTHFCLFIVCRFPSDLSMICASYLIFFQVNGTEKLEALKPCETGDTIQRQIKNLQALNIL